MTKKTALSTIILYFFLSFAAFAQTKTYVGVRGGSNISINLIRHNFYRQVINPRYTSGMNAGIIIKHYNRKNFGVQTGLEFIQKGWTQTFFEFFPDYTARLNYVDIPVLMTVYIGNGRTKYHINMGPFAEVLLSAKLDADPGDVAPFNFHTYDPNRDGSFGYGIRGGGGISHDFNFGQIHLEAFLAFSFSNVFDPPSRSSFVPDNSNNFVTGISIAYLLPFGKLSLVNK